MSGGLSRDLRVNIDGDPAGLERGFKSAEKSAEVFERELQKIEKRRHAAMTQLGTGASVLGAGMVLAFGAAIKVSADFDKQMSAVSAATGQQGKALDVLRDAAIKAGQATTFSATEAAQAETELAKVGLSTSDILGGALKGSLDLAAAGQLDLADAAAISGEAMTIFKLKGQDVGHIADVLTAGATASSASVESMAMSLQQAGLVSAQTGLSLEDTVGTLTAFSKAGLNGSDAGTSLKTMLQRLAAPASDAAGLMDQLGIHAYDAQGQFVGIDKVAGQLRTSLSTLTPAQRQAALATIFGSDAIRAATVLYTNGEAGIRGYIGAVNDQGAAARQAATLTDNLAGDIERLGGSLETALIQSGSGATGVLRELTQAASGAVDTFNALPQPVQTGLTLLGGLAGVVATVSGAFLVGVPKVAEYKAALGDMGPRAQKFGSAIGAVGSFLTGPWGLAIGAGVAVLGIFAAKHAEAEQRVADLTATLDAQTGAITADTRAKAINTLETDGVMKAARELGLNLSTVTDAALGNKPALDGVNAGLEAAKENFKGGGYQGKQFQEKLNLVSGSLNDQNSDLVESRERWLRNKEAMGGAAPAATAVADAVSEMGSASQIAAGETENLRTEIDKLTSAAFDSLDADIAYQQAIDDVTEAIKRNGHTSDLGTQKGRDNVRKLEELADKGTKWRRNLENQHASIGRVNAAAEVQRTIFISSARAMGKTSKEASDLAASLGVLPGKSNASKAAFMDAATAMHIAKGRAADLWAAYQKIPKAAKTQISTPGYRPSLAALHHIQDEATDLGRMHPTVHIGAEASGGYGVLNSLLARIGSSHANVSVGVLKTGAHGYITALANGSENHVAEIAPAGAMRLWAEPETGGEAYIPLAPSKRARSTAILGAVADRFGYDLEKMANGGVLSFASGGMVADVPLSEFIDRYVGTPATRSDVKTALNHRKDQVEQLRKAERKLEDDRRHHKSARTIADDEARVAKERRDVVAATDKLRTTEARYKKTQQAPIVKFSKGLVLGVKNTEAFIKNVTKLADMGFVSLAQQLLSMGGPEAEKYAAAAVKLSTAKLKSLNNNVERAQKDEARLAQLPNILAVKNAVKHGAKSVPDIERYTGLSEDEIAQANQVGKVFAAGGIERYAAGGWRPGPGVATKPTVLFGEGKYPEGYVSYDPRYRTRSRGLISQMAGDFGMGGGSVRGGDTYVIHVNGALDKMGAAREIEKIMKAYGRNTGQDATL